MSHLIYLDPDSNRQSSRPGKGPVPAEFAIVGMSPSTNRPFNRDNEPFGASSWKLVQRIRQTMVGNVYITNFVKHPVEPGQKPPRKSMGYFYPLLMRELLVVHPRRILTLGTLPAQVLCPAFTNLKEDHGTMFWNAELEAHVIPTYHFSALAKNPALIDIISRDLFRWAELPDPVAPTYNFEPILGIPADSTVYLDIETTGLNPEIDTIISVGLTVNDWPEVHIYDHPSISDLKGILQLIRNAKATVVGHNVAFDLDFLQRATEAEWDGFCVRDTMQMAHVLGEEGLALKHLTTMLTDRPGSRAYGGPEDSGYLAEDVLSTRELDQLLIRRGALKAFASNLLNDLLPHIVNMKTAGVRIDTTRLKSLLPVYHGRVQEISTQLNDLAGSELNWNSTAQVTTFLLEQGIPLTEKTKTGKFTIKESVMLELAGKYPVADLILKLREQEKELSFLTAYNDKTLKEPFLHPRLKLTGARTGRISCEDPNVQQVKRTGPIKTLFISRFPGGKIGLIDLSQAELRIAAMLSGDEEFAAALLSDDVHKLMASIAFGIPVEEITATQRKKSKGITFGLLYGGSTSGLAARTGLSEDGVAEILERLFRKYPKLMSFIEYTKKIGVRDQRITTPMGRIRSLRSIIITKGAHDAERKAINTPIQGTASDVALMIMNYCADRFKRYKMDSRVIFGVHDSVLLDIHPMEITAVSEVVKAAFVNLKNSPLSELPLWPTLPLVGELVIGDTWAHIESTNENYDAENNLTFPCTSLPEVGTGGVISERSDDTDESDEENPEVEEIDPW